MAKVRVRVPDNEVTRTLEFLKKFHPQIYAGLRVEHPDLIKAVYANYTPLNGLGDFNLSNILDTISGFADKTVKTLNAKNAFDAQLRKARQTPVRVIQQAPRAAFPPVHVQLSPSTAERVAAMEKSRGLFGVPWTVVIPAGIAVLGGIAYLVFGRKHRR